MSNEAAPLKKVYVNQVELHYTEQGAGIPLIFVHGGLWDYRFWSEQAELFAPHYRVITYSRRYNYPNQNSAIVANHSAIGEAQDLAAMIQELALGQVYVVGTSYGAYTALFLAYLQPELVRAMVLGEPPMLRLLLDTPEGTAVFTEFRQSAWEPLVRAFQQGEKEQALKPFIDYMTFPGAFDQMPAARHATLVDNLREFEALAYSTDDLPLIPRAQLRAIQTPILMLSGANSVKMHRLVDQDLAQLLPKVERVTIQEAGHSMWRDNPIECREKTLAFLARQPGLFK